MPRGPVPANRNTLYGLHYDVFHAVLYNLDIHSSSNISGSTSDCQDSQSHCQFLTHLALTHALFSKQRRPQVTPLPCLTPSKLFPGFVIGPDWDHTYSCDLSSPSHMEYEGPHFPVFLPKLSLSQGLDRFPVTKVLTFDSHINHITFVIKFQSVSFVDPEEVLPTVSFLYIYDAQGAIVLPRIPNKMESPPGLLLHLPHWVIGRHWIVSVSIGSFFEPVSKNL